MFMLLFIFFFNVFFFHSFGEGISVLSNRSFAIASDGSTLLKDGQPFRVFSGCFHYWRTPAAEWEARFRTFNTSGLNAVQTYIAWNFQCPKMNQPCSWDGDRDIFRFLDLAQKYGLYVMLRPGPYICAGPDFGGLPAWLLKYDRHPQVRTSDPVYLSHAKYYLDQLLPRLRKYMYHQGGPVIMVQIENEYGYVAREDKGYLIWLRDLFKSYLGEEQLLYTIDGVNLDFFKRTAISGVYQTIDFYSGDVNSYWQIQRSQMGKISLIGPPFDDEFYPGWDTFWGDKNIAYHDRKQIMSLIKEILVTSSNKSNLNMYMFHGGTNFEFWSQGSTDEKYVTTTYDYSAPMNESGHATDLFMMMKEFIPNITGYHRPTGDIIQPPPLAYYGNVTWTDSATLVTQSKGSIIPAIRDNLVFSSTPLSMEEVDQNYGFISYEVPVPPGNKGDVAVSVTAYVYDYALVYADNVYLGFLFKTLNNTISLPPGVQKVLFVVENRGRNYWWQYLNKYVFAKGILDPITFKYNGTTKPLSPNLYTISTLPMEYPNVIKAFNSSHRKIYQKSRFGNTRHNVERDNSNTGFFLRGTIKITQPPAGGTMFDMRGFQKGFVFINGHMLGRYWTLMGPQYSLYCPPSYLNYNGDNEVIVFEQRMLFTEDKPPMPYLTLSNINFNTRIGQ